MNETMDNQQVSTEALAWLAGIIDGEGTINIMKKPTRRHVDGTMRYNYWTFVQVCNTNEPLILKVIEIFKMLGSNPYVWEKKATDKWKKAYQISLQNMAKSRRILIKILPYLIAKKRHAELTITFIDSRLKKYNSGRGNHNPYTKEEMEMITEIKRLNFRGNLRDFVPESLRG